MNEENAKAGLESLDALMANQQKVLLKLIRDNKALKHENVSLKKEILKLKTEEKEKKNDRNKLEFKV